MYAIRSYYGLSDFCNVNKLSEGDTITILNGITICEKYIPKETKIASSNQNKNKGKKAMNKTKYPMFEEHIDTSQLAYNLNQFDIEDTCYITLKMHGTSGRTAYTIKESIEKQNFIQRLLRIKNKKERSWEIVSGTRRVVLSNYDNGS